MLHRERHHPERDHQMNKITLDKAIYNAMYPATEPVNPQQALESPGRKQWQAAIKTELEALIASQT